jgi:hypothetical protein
MTTLEDLLDEITVHQIDDHIVNYNKELGKDISQFLGMFCVEDGEKGDIGYFLNDSDAFGYRLFLINIRLNYK